MPRKFLVVEERPDGGVELFPMRNWCCAHPELMPVGLDVRSVNSHRIRDELKRIGWSVEENDTQVLMFSPGFKNKQQVQEVLGNEPSLTENDEIEEAKFGLEKDLQYFLAGNIETIRVNGKKLKLYIDPTGLEGIEFRTDVGRIDILAEDSDGGLVVFELKRASAPDSAIGQLTRYMGWLKKTIGRSRPIHGVIVARKINATLAFSVAAVPNVSLFEYKVKFDLLPISEASAHLE